MVRLFSLLVAALLAVLVAAPVTAASPHTVDPSTVTPPLNPGFAPWTCIATGGGPVCRGTESFSWDAAGLGLSCGDHPIFTTGSASIDGTRWSAPDGRATDSAFHSDVVERWSLSANASGRSLLVRARFNEAFHYGTPGDLSTRTYRLTGGYYQVTAAGTGLVWHDTGYSFTPAGADAPTVLHGQHDSENGILEEILVDACAILAG
jgi:hypothetical protein